MGVFLQLHIPNLPAFFSKIACKGVIFSKSMTLKTCAKLKPLTTSAAYQIFNEGYGYERFRFLSLASHCHKAPGGSLGDYHNFRKPSHSSNSGPFMSPQHFQYCTKRHKVLKSSPFSQATSCCFFLQLSMGHLPQHPLVIEAWQRLPRTPTANPKRDTVKGRGQGPNKF